MITIVTACNANDVLIKVDKKIAAASLRYLNKKRYDLTVSVDVDAMLLLIQLRNMLISKLKGNSCYTQNKQEIISKILNLIN